MSKAALKKSPPKRSSVSVQLDIPKDIYAHALSILESRGTDIPAFLSLQLCALKNTKLLGLADSITFGKYSGENIERICRNDPTYIEWLIKNSRAPRFEQEVADFLNELLD